MTDKRPALPTALTDIRRRIEWFAAPWAPHWTALRSISNTAAARAVILVPLIGYWIILSDWAVAAYAALSKEVVGDIATVPWQLFAVYFGLWLVGLGSALYLLFCPAEIKLHATASGYVGSVVPQISSLEGTEVYNEVREGDERSLARLEELEQRATALRQAYGEEDADFFARARDERLRNVLQAHFEYCNRRYAVARLLATVAYGFGFAALSVASVSILYRVVRVAIG